MNKQKVDFRIVKNFIMDKYANDENFKKNNEGRTTLEGTSVNNNYLAMQKYLYFVNLSYFLMTGQTLFDNDFYAYNNGSYMRDLKDNGLYDNEDNYDELNPETKNIIEQTMNYLKNLNVQDLIDMNHSDVAWTNTKSKGGSDKISLDSFEDKFKKLPMYKRYLESLGLPVESSILNGQTDRK